MIRRRSRHVVVALATLVAPLAAVAQPVTAGSVTTAPLSTVPAMGMPLLALLVIVLAGAGAYFLRRAGGGAIAQAGFVAALTALAGLAYAIPPNPIPVEGDQCRMQTVQPFNPSEPNMLVSHCPQPIQIISVDVSCGTLGIPHYPRNPCEMGQVLPRGDTCGLPMCREP